MARSARSKGLKDKAYLAFISRLACIVCASELMRNLRSIGQVSPTEVAHVGERGLSQKCSDRETLPLCMWHHRIGPEAHHKLGKKFWDHHGLDKDVLIAEYNRKYEEERVA